MIPDIIETHVAIDQSESPTSSPEQTLAARIRQKQNATSPSPTLTKHGLAASVAQLSTETQSPDLTPATKHRLTQATSEYQLLPGRSSALAGASTGHARKGTRNDDSDMGRRRFNPHAAAGRSKSYASELQNASSLKISTGDGKTHMDSSHGETTHNSDNTRVSRVFDQTKGESRRSAMLLHVEHDGMLSGSRSSLFPGGWKGSGVSMAGSMSLIEEITENNTEFATRSIPKWLTLMGKNSPVDMEAAASDALGLKASMLRGSVSGIGSSQIMPYNRHPETSTYLLKNNEVRKIRVALEGSDIQIEAILHLLAVLMTMESNARFLLDNQLVPKIASMLNSTNITIRAKTASVLCAISQYPSAALRFGKLGNTMELLIRTVKSQKPSVITLEIYTSLHRISCVEDHQELMFKHAPGLLSLFLQNIRDCLAYINGSQTPGNEIDLEQHQVYKWLTSMFGIITNLHMRNEKLRLHSIELGYIPIFLFFFDKQFRTERHLFFSAINAYSLTIMKEPAVYECLGKTINRIGTFIIDEHQSLTEAIRANDLSRFEQSVEMASSLIGLWKRILLKFDEQSLQLALDVTPDIFENVLAIMADTVLFVDHMGIDVSDGMIKLFVTCLEIVRQLLILLQKRAELDSPRDGINEKFTSLFTMRVQEAIRIMLLVKSPKIVIHHCISALQQLSSMALFQRTLKELDVVPDITFVVIDAMYAWETSASLESLSDHIATTAIMASSINLGTSRLCLAETGDSSGASNTMLNEVHNSQQHLARMFSPEVRVQRRRSSMAQGIAQRRRNSTDLLGEMAASTDLLKVNRLQTIGGAHPKTAMLSSTAPAAVDNTDVAVKLLAEPVKSVHEMDVILEALGFLNSSLVANHGVSHITNYTMPAVATLLQKCYKYNHERDKDSSHLLHDAVIRLLHNLIVKDDAATSKLHLIYVNEVVYGLLSSNEATQRYSIEIILTICRYIDNSNNVEGDMDGSHSARVNFLSEIMDRDAMDVLDLVAHSPTYTNAALAQTARVELLLKLSEQIVTKKRNFDIWSAVADDWLQDDARRDLERTARQEAAKIAAKKQASKKK